MLWAGVLAALVVGLALGARIGSRRAAAAAARAVAPRVDALEAELEELRRQYETERQLRRATFEAVDDGLIVIDRRERITDHNETASRLLQLPAGRLTSLVAATGSAELRQAVQDACSGVAPPGVPAEVRLDGRSFHVYVVPLSDGGALIFMRDHTEVQRLLRARRDLIANVSHDLRTPLTSLVLLAEMLLDETEPTTRRELGDRIREQVETLRSLAEVLVDLNQLESGRVLLKLEPVRLLDMVSAATDGMAAQVEKAGVQVIVSVPPDAFVLADRSHVLRVLTNLLDNALRYARRHGTLRVGARPGEEADRLEVFVSDDGPGIPLADADRVFERFYRADRARSGSGKGLGLAIARHVVEGHGGRIWVDRTVRQGASICFTLPRAE